MTANLLHFCIVTHNPLHISLVMSHLRKQRNFDIGCCVVQVEIFEDLMLSLCRKSVHLAVKLIWWLRGYLEDLSAISELDVNSDAPGKKVYKFTAPSEDRECVIE